MKQTIINADPVPGTYFQAPDSRSYIFDRCKDVMATVK